MAEEKRVKIPEDFVRFGGILKVPKEAQKWGIFAHGSGDRLM
ncbi:MAG: hypothetical protein ABR903_01425 [Thermodesulfovibrionales bacterium]|jgi:hypothetical protein